MPFRIEKIASILCCPDDRKSLRPKDMALECCHCGRIYSVWEEEILELLPSQSAEPQSNPEYAADYQRQFHRTFETQEHAIAWGLLESRSASWKRHRQRQAQTVLSMLERGGVALRDLILCDISAGVGHYTLAYWPHFKWVLHCDLSIEALRCSRDRFRRMGCDNVFLLRVDYFALPFSRSIDRLLCLDTLIRGEDHEKALLNQIQRAISDEGRAIIDFHHWWHNPLRRLGLMRQNFGSNRSYTRSGAEDLMRECGIRDQRLVRFYQELEAPFSKGFSWLLPATRLLYEFGCAASGHASPASAEAFANTSQPNPSKAARSAAEISNAASLCAA
jgi:ubiquinone/menaquinone biosynthesis C-methylase UbiE